MIEKSFLLNCEIGHWLSKDCDLQRLIFFIVLWGSTALADVNQYEMAVCAGYPTEQEVSDCLREFGGRGVEPDQIKDPDGEVIGDWVLADRKLTSRGEPYWVATTHASNRLDDDFNREVQPFLIMQCQGDRFYATINWQRYVGVKQRYIHAKRPGRESTRRYWAISNGGRETYISKERAGWLVWVLKNYKKVSFSVVADGGQKLTAEFNIDGLKQVYDRLSSVCPSGFDEPGRN